MNDRDWWVRAVVSEGFTVATTVRAMTLWHAANEAEKLMRARLGVTESGVIDIVEVKLSGP